MQKLLSLLISAQQAMQMAEQKLQELQAIDIVDERGQVKKLLERYSKVEKSIREEKKKVLADLLDLAVAGGIKDCYLPIGTCYTYEICSAKKVTVSVDDRHRRYIQPEDRAIIRSFDVDGFVDCRRLFFFEFCRDILSQIESIFKNHPQQQEIQISMLRRLKEKLVELANRTL